MDDKSMKATPLRWNLTILILVLALIAYIGFLLSANYPSQTQFQESALNQLKLAAEERAATMSYFFSERKNDLRSLVATLVLFTGGLNANLPAINKLFDRTTQQKRIRNNRIYDWIVLVDSFGQLLAGRPSAQTDSHDWKRFLDPTALKPRIITEGQGETFHQFISIAHFLENQYAGQIVARIANGKPYTPIIMPPAGTVGQYLYMATDKHYFQLLPQGKLPFSLDFSQNPVALESGKTHHLTGKVKRLDVLWEDGSQREMLAVTTPVDSTSLELILLTRLTRVPGYLTHRQILLVTGFLMLIFSVIALRDHTQNTTFKVRIDEAEKQQRILADSNARLSAEIEKRRCWEERLHHLANHDPLTDLPNRSLFTDRLNHALRRAHRENTEVGLLFLDLDHFKDVNDTFGHPVGDQFLQVIAQRISSCIRDEDTVARLGGDEFIIILEDIKAPQDAATVAQKVLDTLGKPVYLNDKKILLTASIGISLYPQDGQEATDLIKNSDIAMYRAKGQGKNNYQFYVAELTISAVERLALETRLHHAVERGELILYYQPQVSFETRRIVGVEALIRWRHPDLGLLGPRRFIDVAEETGLIEPIGEWVLLTACKQARAWQLAGLPPICIAINASSRQFQGGLYSIVERTLQDTGVDPKHLELEITEKSIMEQPDKIIANLNALKNLGVNLTIDDFGTGYLSMSYFRRFNVDKLKIDQSFIQDIPEDKTITRAIIALGHSVGLTVVAEGVETCQQRTFLQAEGCDQMQGYLFSKPLIAAELEQLLIRGAVNDCDSAPSGRKPPQSQARTLL